jgi:hypothetical protein
MASKKYFHFTQAYEIDASEDEIDFFDANLAFDSRLFVDPFLLKRSSIQDERELYKAFDIYFKAVLERSIHVISGAVDKEYLHEFLVFPEPSEVCLGYTESSVDGSGLATHFSSSLTSFFLKGIASKLKAGLGDTEISTDFNPDLFRVFADDVADDGISDLAINLIMDYLVVYTQRQCERYNVPVKELPVGQSFDFEELEWTGGIRAQLPENPLRPGRPVILIPKRLLRAHPISSDQMKSKTVSILRQDAFLKRKFAKIVFKPLRDISFIDVRLALLEDQEVLTRFIQLLDTKESRGSYDFTQDALEFLAIKKYSNYFNAIDLPDAPQNCSEFLSLVNRLVQLFKEDYEQRDSWKDCWVDVRKNHYKKEITEPAWGRSFRGKALGFFEHFPQITFIPEAGSGNGPSDFLIVFLDCRVVIEFKKLSNGAPSGPEKIPAYLHGVMRQLPEYTVLQRAKHAIYITGQHHFRNRPTGSSDHSDRAVEIQDCIADVCEQIKQRYPDFESLTYTNIDLAPKPSASGR